MDVVGRIPIEDSEALPRHSYTYRVDFENKKVGGMVTDLPAVNQATEKILLTERFAYPIYSDGYGIMTNDLIGKPAEYIIALLPARVYEALSYDDRLIELETISCDVDTDNYDTIQYIGLGYYVDGSVVEFATEVTV